MDVDEDATEVEQTQTREQTRTTRRRGLGAHADGTSMGFLDEVPVWLAGLASGGLDGLGCKKPVFNLLLTWFLTRATTGVFNPEKSSYKIDRIHWQGLCSAFGEMSLMITSQTLR